MKILMMSLLLSLGLQAHGARMTDYTSQLKTWQNSKLPLKAKLEKIYDLHWKYQMSEFPEWATYNGTPGENDRWTDLSFSAIEQRKKNQLATLKAIQSLSPKGLKEEDLLSYKLFLKDATEAVEGQEFPEELLPLNQMQGIQTDVSDLMLTAPKQNLKDYQDRIRRLEAVPALAEQVQDLMQTGIQKNVLPAKITLVTVPSQFDQVLTEKVEDSPIFEEFKTIPASLGSAQEIQKIQAQAKAALTEKVYPALKKLRSFFNSEYLPKCRESVGLSDLPNGKKWYAFRIRNQTTVSMSADEIHTLGLNEVARIKAEMEKVKTDSGFKGSLEKFNQFLKEDSQFTFKNSQDLMMAYRDIAKRVDPELIRFFSVLPRLTYGVREMPAFKAPSSPTAYYNGGSLEAGRPGYFEANTYNLKARPKWQMEALTLHEAVPGHHLQISLAQELPKMPEFRRNTGPTSFVEGWGLYAESLGSDLGLYKDPYSKYGQLTFEIWRAIRLVVDTGLHAKGWSRDQVIKYFKDNSPISDQQIINETDRYITWPGQALAYKIGELKFKQLKVRAQAQLGEKFDIRKFHDELLGSGALPMDVIEAKIDSWIAQVKKTK